MFCNYTPCFSALQIDAGSIQELLLFLVNLCFSLSRAFWPRASVQWSKGLSEGCPCRDVALQATSHPSGSPLHLPLVLSSFTFVTLWGLGKELCTFLTLSSYLMTHKDDTLSSAQSSVVVFAVA